MITSAFPQHNNNLTVLYVYVIATAYHFNCISDKSFHVLVWSYCVVKGLICPPRGENQRGLSDILSEKMIYLKDIWWALSTAKRAHVNSKPIQSY